MDVLRSIELDHSIDQRLLNIEEKSRNNLFPWNGQFSPQLIECLLSEFASRGDFVLDPFVGSGTVLVESARQRLAAFGSDINPAPFKLASVYRLINLDTKGRRRAIHAVESSLDNAIWGTFELSNGDDSEDVRESLLVARGLLDDEWGQTLFDALVILLDFHRPLVSRARVSQVWSRLRSTVESLPESGCHVEVVNCDARKLERPAGTFSLAVTSPPYINVFNYHQKYRRSAESLGYDLLHVAVSEIGSNRKHRGNRFLTVIQYCLDMTQALNEMCRVCRHGSRIIVVIGRESQVRKTPFFNGDILARLAIECVGIQPDLRQERVFTNRFGIRITEDILHFVNEKRAPATAPSVVAREVLESARSVAPQESLRDLDDAIDRLDEVSASRIYSDELQVSL